MEPMEAEGQWTSLNGIYTAEEADFMALLLSNTFPLNNQTLPSFWLGGHESTENMAGNYRGSHCSLELSNSSFCSFSRGNSSTSGDIDSNGFSTSSNEQYCPLGTDHHHSLKKSNFTNSISLMSFDFGIGDLKASTNSYLVEGDTEDRDEIGNGISEGVAPQKKVLVLEKSGNPSDGNSAKRTRCLENMEIAGKRNTKSKKKQKLSLIKNDDEELLGNAGASNGQSSSSCGSGDESINCGIHDMSSGGDTSSLSQNGPTGSALNLDGKTRARRGSATDPQSLYARKRRERINERLRILQNLVPNGTKVDISTMLEEAVQYVKFLQLQIKLLSSDEMWMYAPIAYNGMDIGLDHLKLSMATKQS